MIDKIRAFFSSQADAVQQPGQAREHALQLAMCTLLVEMSRADKSADLEEAVAILTATRARFELTDTEAQQLMAIANDQADHATSLYEFTRVLNDHLDHDQKIHAIELLWQIAFADGHIDRYEDHLVRKVSQLLHVSHRDFIAAKHRIEAAESSSMG